MSQRDRKRIARSNLPSLRLHFLGAARGVTGSLHFFEYTENGKTIRFFVDAGLNQEHESANYTNRLPSGLKASDIDFGIFTHSHLDHVGYFPKLVKDGFKGPAYATTATKDLMAILLPDSGHIQEEETRAYNQRQKRRELQTANKPKEQKPPAKAKPKAVSKSKTAAGKETAKAAVAAKPREPLYTEAEARNCLQQVECVEFGVKFSPAPSISFQFSHASHLLGAAIVSLEIGKGSQKRRIVCSGDLGRPGMPIIKDIEAVRNADYILCEGTYGARLHPKRNRLDELANIVNAAYERASKSHKKDGHGVIIVPAFALGRVQGLLYDLRRLISQNKIPNLPVFVDSPMANRVTEVYRKHVLEYNKETLQIAEKCDPFKTPQYAEIIDAAQSMKLDEPASQPIMIISPSGMAAGGRVVHHLKMRLPAPNNTVIFVGFQAEGTLGHQVVSSTVKKTHIAGEEVPMRAAVHYLPDYSGHGDADDIVAWLKGFQTKPKKLFLVHGDDKSLGALKERVEKLKHWDVVIPSLHDYVDLD